MRGIARKLSLAVAVIVLSVVTISPAAAASPSQCSLAIVPGAGSSTDVYRIYGTGFPPGSFEQFTDVRIDVRRAGDGRFGTTFFLTLFPLAGGAFYVDFHESFPEWQPDPLALGRYLVHAEAGRPSGHGNACAAEASFVVR